MGEILNDIIDDFNGLDEQEFSSDTAFHQTYKIKFEHAVSLENVYILHTAAIFQSNSIRVMTAFSDFSCAVYDIDTCIQKNTEFKTAHTDVITGIKAISENIFYTSSCDGTIKLWDLRTFNSSMIFTDDSDRLKKLKSINCFDVSYDNRFICAGTPLIETNAYILFWDVRMSKVLGGYWNTHTDDITQLKFNSLQTYSILSGSVDGLINLYDVRKSSEDDALLTSLNAECSIQKLQWIKKNNVACITDMETLQFWDTNESKPYADFERKLIGSAMYIKCWNNAYIVDVHEMSETNTLVLCGSNFDKGDNLKLLIFSDMELKPFATFHGNKQIIRCCCFDNSSTLITAGESGIITVWEESDSTHFEEKTNFFCRAKKRKNI